MHCLTKGNQTRLHINCLTILILLKSSYFSYSLFNSEIFKENYISVAGYFIKQRDVVEYLGCQLDSKLSGEALASKFFRKINVKLKFLFRESIYLIPALRRLLGNALIQAHFDCGCSSQFPLLNKKFQIKFQKAQNRYIRFCLNLPSRSPIDPSHFRKIKLHPATDRVEHRF